MLNPIFIEATKDFPQVVLNKEQNHFEISGRSLPEDAIKFYSPIKDWFLKYVENPNEKTVLIIKLEYYNSSSAKILVKLFMEFEKIFVLGKDVQIDWYYKEKDDVILERGDEIKEFLTLPVNLIAY